MRSYTENALVVEEELFFQEAFTVSIFSAPMLAVATVINGLK